MKQLLDINSYEKLRALLRFGYCHFKLMNPSYELWNYRF